MPCVPGVALYAGFFPRLQPAHGRERLSGGPPRGRQDQTALGTRGRGITRLRRSRRPRCVDRPTSVVGTPARSARASGGLSPLGR